MSKGVMFDSYRSILVEGSVFLRDSCSCCFCYFVFAGGAVRVYGAASAASGVHVFDRRVNSCGCERHVACRGRDH